MTDQYFSMSSYNVYIYLVAFARKSSPFIRQQFLANINLKAQYKNDFNEITDTSFVGLVRTGNDCNFLTMPNMTLNLV